MAPKSVTFRRHDHLVSVLFGDLLSHSYNITFSMFLYLVLIMIKLNYNVELIGISVPALKLTSLLRYCMSHMVYKTLYTSVIN